MSTEHDEKKTLKALLKMRNTSTCFYSETSLAKEILKKAPSCPIQKACVWNKMLRYF